VLAAFRKLDAIAVLTDPLLPAHPACKIEPGWSSWEWRRASSRAKPDGGSWAMAPVGL